MTDLLLDTHVVLWWLADDPRLSAAGRELIMRAGAVQVSAASTWEIAIKSAIGRLELDLPEGSSLPEICQDQGFSLTGVDHRDAWAGSCRPRAATRSIGSWPPPLAGGGGPWSPPTQSSTPSGSRYCVPDPVLLDEAVYHIEHLRLGARDTAKGRTRS